MDSALDVCSRASSGRNENGATPDRNVLAWPDSMMLFNPGSKICLLKFSTKYSWNSLGTRAQLEEDLAGNPKQFRAFFHEDGPQGDAAVHQERDSPEHLAWLDVAGQFPAVFSFLVQMQLPFSHHRDAIDTGLALDGNPGVLGYRFLSPRSRRPCRAARRTEMKSAAFRPGNS